jgi:hypothetical protein
MDCCETLRSKPQTAEGAEPLYIAPATPYTAAILFIRAPLVLLVVSPAAGAALPVLLPNLTARPGREQLTYNIRVFVFSSRSISVIDLVPSALSSVVIEYHNQLFFPCLLLRQHLSVLYYSGRDERCHLDLPTYYRSLLKSGTSA